ncbi:MAG TPA: DNA translocase FtsK [Desulfosporosinus sp.]|nr:DNA translocase FtsK [Desulfosporosinus sp.]
MSKGRNKGSSFWLKLISVLLMVLALTGLLGAFDFSIGAPVSSMFKRFMGGLAWAGPFLCFVLALLLWLNSSIFSSISVENSDMKSVKNSRTPINKRHKRSAEGTMDQFPNSKDIPLPSGKLVSLKGFNQYFSSPNWVEMKDKDMEKAEEMKEMGKDFPSYFGTGKSIRLKKQPNMTVLKGLKHYFNEVDQEERLDLAREERKKPVTNVRPVESPVKAMHLPSVFKSKTEQEEFLAQFKEDESSREQRIEKDSISKTEEMELNLQSISNLKSLDIMETESVSGPESESELDPESEPAPKSEPVAVLEANCVLLSEPNPKGDMNEPNSLDVDLGLEFNPEIVLELEAPVAAAASLKSDFVEQVIKLETVKPVVPQSLEKVKHWEFPALNLLEPIPQRTLIQDPETTRQLEKVLLDFGVKARVIRVTRGPVITRYELAPAPGVKISKIVNLSDDIALGLAARDVRIEAPIPGKAAIGIEVPNKQAHSVPFREVLETSHFGEYPSKLKVALGKDIADQPIIADLIKMPHLLVAGATGSGKSVCITTIINSILFNATPDEVKFLLVDPKMVELSQYNGIPHLLAPVVVDPKKAASALKWIVKEMENRYELFAASGVRDIDRYNKLKAGGTSRDTPAMPLVVVIIDELADLMMVAAGEVEEAICRLAQMARAAGIHLVIATQRPSVDVITGVIKANIPSRISFAVSSQIDSRTILDATGAEKLLGRGDMLYSPLGVNKALRVQGCLVTDDEVQRVIMHWKGLGKPEYLDPERLFAEATVKSEEGNGPDDALFIDAGQLFIKTGIASVSYLQRRLKLGYTRAARLMDMLEEQGIVGAYEGSKPRQVLLTLEEFNERFG